MHVLYLLSAAVVIGFCVGLFIELVFGRDRAKSAPIFPVILAFAIALMVDADFLAMTACAVLGFIGWYALYIQAYTRLKPQGVKR